ncbi:MAG: V-type ATP synthase subunit D [Treponema sp.]|nr:V-type ATP synthase subunit D [Treponema sp.]
MSIQGLAPTKSNLLKEKENLALATEGYELLERKREILMIELMKRVDEAKMLEHELERASEAAYASMRRMIFSLGREGAAELAEGAVLGASVRESTVQVAGLRIPALEAVVPERRLQSSFVNSFAESDETMLEFHRVLKLAVAMSAIRSVVWRLAREVRKTQRRVNALEKMVIPDSKARKTFIEASLEEREREAVFAVKLLKTRGAKRGAT